MTDKEITRREDEIYYRVYKGGVRIGKWNLFTDAEKRELAELQCRQMINSILVYWGENSVTDKSSYCYERYLKDDEEELGTETVDRLVKEQIEDFSKAVTYWDKNSYGISGGPYKCVVWADEKVA